MVGKAIYKVNQNFLGNGKILIDSDWDLVYDLYMPQNQRLRVVWLTKYYAVVALK